MAGGGNVLLVVLGYHFCDEYGGCAVSLVFQKADGGMACYDFAWLRGIFGLTDWYFL